MEEFIALQNEFAESVNSWTADVGRIDAGTYDLWAKNPNQREEAALRDPLEIMEEMAVPDAESADILTSIRRLL